MSEIKDNSGVKFTPYVPATTEMKELTLKIPPYKGNNHNLVITLIWWYLQRYYSFIGDGEQGTANGEILKRGYAFSHFSKFIRPGFVRVDASTSKYTGLEITAYKGNNQIVVVIINQNNYWANNINLEVPSVSSASAYETSVNLNRAKKEVNLSDGKVVLNISPKSITTIVVEK